MSTCSLFVLFYPYARLEVSPRQTVYYISFHLFADNIAIYKAGTVISNLQVTTGQ